jgi:hypothetical protein
MNRKAFKAILTFCACGLALQEMRLEAFSLLGPYEAWMQPSNCFRLPVTVIYEQPGDVGGPMCISNGYRWNVPVVTYGFDQSFLNFFGTNGVAAVEGAIQILNNIPPASSVVLTNYPDDTELINAQAQAQSLYDLQSVTLSLLLEQLGLASPTRSVFVLRAWNPIFIYYGASFNWPDGTIPQYVVMRNFDPESLSPTPWVNGVEYEGFIWSGLAMNVNESEIMMSPADVEESHYTAVADNRLEVGGFYTGLTADDVGGLCYLYSTNNVNYESLPSGVSGVGTNANSLVNGAWRPGIDKITFVPHPSGSSPWEFLPMTNQYTDSYITNGSVMQQQVQRVISQPDFLFCAGDTGQEYPVVLPYARTGTTNWINNAALNGNLSGGGPGVIQPPVIITFDTLGPLLETYGSELVETNYDESLFWGTYDQSTNAPIIYPLPQSGTNQLILRLWFPYGLPYPVPLGRSVELSATGQIGASFLLQTSTNLTDWISLATNQINGSIFTLIEWPIVAGRFYRLIPR